MGEPEITPPPAPEEAAHPADDRPPPGTSDDEAGFTPDELNEAWPLLSREERIEGLKLLTRTDLEEYFSTLGAQEQADIIRALPPAERRSWIRILDPDDMADLVQATEQSERDWLLALLDDATRREVTALLAYAEDDAGGLMNPRYGRLRPDMSVDEAIRYIRKQAVQRIETLYYLYVLDAQQHLLGVVSFRELFSADPSKKVSEVMRTELVKAHEQMDQEKLSQLFSRHTLMAIPVVDGENHMKGIVTFDDIADVVREEATEDMQKAGGMEALDAPYMKVTLTSMIKKRAGWLAILFLGEMLTASAMGFFEHEIASAVVLALFIPLIISSGGNSGSQATTLMIRAMALEEVRLNDILRVARRELLAGLALGAILGGIGMTRVLIWGALFHSYGEHYILIAVTVALSLIGIVMWGTMAGSMLPFALRKVGLDPASASAPFVATLVDVTGLIIYFTFAKLILTGTLL